MIKWRGEVWQDGMRVAMVEGPSFARIKAETAHYAYLYSEDGLVEVKLRKVGAKRKPRSKLK